MDSSAQPILCIHVQGSGAHDHSRHKIAIHPKFPRHKITPKNQQFYLSIFYSSPSTKHATRHKFHSNHSNPCKLHQDDPQHTKMIPQVDSSALQTLSIYISLSTPHINTQHVLFSIITLRGFWRKWILAHNQYYLSMYRKGVLAHMTICVIKSSSTQNFPVIKSPPKTNSSIYLYFTRPPQRSTQHDINFNRTIF